MDSLLKSLFTNVILCHIVQDVWTCGSSDGVENGSNESRNEQNKGKSAVFVELLYKYDYSKLHPRARSSK